MPCLFPDTFHEKGFTSPPTPLSEFGEGQPLPFFIPSHVRVVHDDSP